MGSTPVGLSVTVCSTKHDPCVCITTRSTCILIESSFHCACVYIILHDASLSCSLHCACVVTNSVRFWALVCSTQHDPCVYCIIFNVYITPIIVSLRRCVYDITHINRSPFLFTRCVGSASGVQHTIQPYAGVLYVHDYIYIHKYIYIRRNH